MDNLDRLKEDLKILDSIPEEELKYFSKDPEKMMFDLEVYEKGKDSWEKLKKIRAIFSKKS